MTRKRKRRTPWPTMPKLPPEVPPVQGDPELASVEGLTGRQTLAMAALLQGKSVSQAAVAAGVHRGTVGLWMSSDPIFSGRLKELKADLLRQLHDMVKGEAARSLRFLALVRDDENLPVAQRIKAAQSLLSVVGIQEPKTGPEIFAADEIKALTVLASRNDPAIRKDRAQHNQVVDESFVFSPKGARMRQLLDEVKLHHHALRVTQGRLAELEPAYRGLKGRQHHTWPHRIEFSGLRALAGRHRLVLQSLVGELEELQREYQDVTDKLVEDPLALVQQFEDVAHILKKYSEDAVAEAAQEVGGLYGKAAEIEATLAQRQVRAREAKLEKERAAAVAAAKANFGSGVGTGAEEEAYDNAPQDSD
ncbi:MAG: hypothetical protein IPP14_05865 [Planctomycetes bacterium]|nr:hypothetical protein [Planctomycetota bacterium]